MSLLDQPQELILEQLKLLPVEDAMKLCQGNAELSRLCQNNQLWYYWARRDFPYVDPFPPFDYAEDARTLYRDMLEAEKERRNRLRIQVNRAKHGRYWATSGHASYNLEDTLGRAPRYFSRKEGYNRFVFWPDYNVAGTIDEIFKTFQTAGMHTVKVGELDRMTHGEVGDEPGEYPLTRDLISLNSIDPFNEYDQMIIRGLYT